MIQYLPAVLYTNGFTDLVSVVPPGAPLLPSSHLPQTQLGKIPGRRAPNGLWAGYRWADAQHTLADVQQWQLDGANVGLRTTRFPALDIDTLDPALAAIVQQAAEATLGPAPVRTGRAPKRLLLYRTAEPFGRMRLWIEKGDTRHLIEMLGAGTQCLVYGTHPQTLQPYAWDVDIAQVTAESLTPVTRAQVEQFFAELAQTVDLLGIGLVTREGDGRVRERAAHDPTQLAAPSIDVLREAVRCIPNTDAHFPTREDYIKVGYAIRAAAGEQLEDGFQIFAEWAEQWEGPGGKRNDPEIVRADWRRMKPPFAVGWAFLAELARPHGFNDAALEFEVERGAPEPAEREVRAVQGSDQWLAEQVVTRQRGHLRFVPQVGKWVVWQGGRWALDAELLAEDIVKRELRALADEAVRAAGTSAAEMKAAEKFALGISAAWKVPQVMALVKSDRAVAVSADALDADPWTINTPDGLIDLRTFARRPADPDALCTKQTAVPAIPGPAPRWARFLDETTGGDTEVVAYLQRLAGYCLTGSTREHHLTFVWGAGGNGKSVFLNVLTGILGDYATVAGMDTFTASRSDRHTTEIARLAGARLVTASETEAGKRWDESRIKQLTGGEPVTARFMRQDDFTFRPQFKLLFVGNHKPEIRAIDDAMRRRIQLVEFTRQPARVDPELGAVLRQEWPQILAWMLEGCRAWQQLGLAPPAAVQAATADYFATEDALGRFLLEDCERGDHVEEVQTLFGAWQRWAEAGNEYVGTLKRFSAAMAARGFARTHTPGARRAAFRGVRVRPTEGFETR